MTRRVSRRRALHVLAFSGAGAWLAFGRRPSPATVRIARPLMGTTLHLTVAGGDRDAAAAGEVVAVERGARRRLLSVVVRLEGDGQEEFEPVERIATLDREAVRDRLVASGLWTALRARPFGLIPDPGTAPRSLFVTAIDTRPLAPDPQVVLEGRDHDFVAGVQALGKLSDGPVRLCTRPGASIPGDGIEGVERHEFSGPHPAGLPGTHIHFLDPVGERKTVWHVGYQDVAAAGALFGTGRLPLESASETCGGGGPVSRRESTARNFAVAAAVAVVCSFGVSVTAVGLRGMRESAQDAGRMRNILEVAGLHDPNVSVARGFERVQTRVVDLETGEYVGEEAFDPTAVTPIPPAADVAGLERRPRYVRVHLVREPVTNRVEQIVLPVRGEGWSTLHAFVALDRDLATVRGFTVYEHGETAGLGAEVDNPKWKSLWPGKRVYDPAGEVRLRLVKGAVEPRSPYEVDGLTGATITTEGVGNLIGFWFGRA